MFHVAQGLIYLDSFLYCLGMGIFSKIKSDLEARQLATAKESLNSIQHFSVEYAELFKSWVPDDFCCELNKVEFDAEDIREIIDFLLQVAVEGSDQQLYSFVGANSESFREEFQNVTVEGLAKHLFEGMASSIELRKKYKSAETVLDDITSLGLVALQKLEQHPKYQEALEFTSKNAGDWT